MFSRNYIKIDRKSNRIKNQSFVFIFSAYASFWSIHSSENRIQTTRIMSRNGEKWKFFSLLLYATNRHYRGWSNLFLPHIVLWMVGVVGARKPGTNKSIKLVDFEAKDKRVTTITINQSLLELSNTPFAMGSSKNILVRRTRKTHMRKIFLWGHKG